MPQQLHFLSNQSSNLHLTFAGKDLPALDVLTVVLGSGPVSDTIALMERVDLLPPSGGAAAAESASASKRTRTPLKMILKTHGVVRGVACERIYLAQYHIHLSTNRMAGRDFWHTGCDYRQTQLVRIHKEDV